MGLSMPNIMELKMKKVKEIKEVKEVKSGTIPTGEITDPGYICFAISLGETPLADAYRYADNTGLCDLTKGPDVVPNKGFYVKSLKQGSTIFFADDQGLINFDAETADQPKFKDFFVRAIKDTDINRCNLHGIINLPNRSK
jgi:hypothetical protein